MDEELFSGTIPDLINKKTMNNLQKMLKKPPGPPPDQSYWSNTFSYIYEDYIRPNLFFIIILIILTLFLLYRYSTKETIDFDFEPEEEEEEPSEKDILAEMIFE